MSDEHGLSIVFTDEQQVPVDEHRLRAVASRTASAEGAIGEISLVIVEEERMTELNARYMGEVGPTDVLAFPVDGLVDPAPQDGVPVIVGEVFICPAYALRIADDPAELDLLVAHGVLHLLGFDHDTQDGAAQMRSREVAASGRSGAQAT